MTIHEIQIFGKEPVHHYYGHCRIDGNYYPAGFGFPENHCLVCCVLYCLPGHRVSFFGPRYFHELQEFREKRGRQRLTKASLEEEARQRLAAAKSSKQQNEQDTKEV